MISEHDRQILSQLPVWDPTGDVVAQRRAWEELATVYNQDLPAIGGLEKNVELRSGLRADIAVPKGADPHPVVIYLHGGGGVPQGQLISHKNFGEFRGAPVYTPVTKAVGTPRASGCLGARMVGGPTCMI
jgi:hypothetical protein